VFLRDLSSKATPPAIDGDDIGKSNFERNHVSLTDSWAQSVAEESALASSQQRDARRVGKCLG
jgi:hypothetical protein